LRSVWRDTDTHSHYEPNNHPDTNYNRYTHSYTKNTSYTKATPDSCTETIEVGG